MIAERECASEPLHITIVGAKDDPAARALFAAVRRSPAAYKRVEWFDAREGELPRGDVEYPVWGQAAAFLTKLEGEVALRELGWRMYDERALDAP